MRYPLPNGYSFHIRRNGNCHNVDARLVDSIGGIVIDEVKDFPTKYPRPTCRLSAGDVLRFMLANDTARERMSPDDYAMIEDRAIDMAGLCQVTK